MLLLQGGGLTAHHGGVYEGAAAAGSVPDAVVGIPIVATDAALIPQAAVRPLQRVRVFEP